jgi:uncharacterized delta-60 repeat protein
MAPSEDVAVAVTVDASGYVYVTGYSNGSYGSADYVTIKYNPNGDTIWMARYDGSVNSSNQAAAIAVDESGNVYVTGSCGTIKYNGAGIQQWIVNQSAEHLILDGTGNVYVTGTSNGDYLTIKYNSGGIQQWVARYAGPSSSNDVTAGLAVSASGNVYVTGSSGGDYATVKYNAAGVQQWVARFTGPGNFDDEATAIAVDEFGNVYVTGGSRDTLGTLDYATVKYDSIGNIVWVARYNKLGNFFNQAYAIAVDTSCNVYVTGFSGNSGWGGSVGDYATIKYNSNGDTVWTACYNGPENSEYDCNQAVALALDASGNVYVTGTSYSRFVEQGDYTTVKYNSVGVQQWVSCFTGPGDSRDWVSAFTLDASGNIYVAGTSNGDYATVKYNSAGVQQWNSQYKGIEFSNDEVDALAVDKSGNVYVAGTNVTVKFSNNGVFQWVIKQGANILAVDDSGNVFLPGMRKDDCFIVKYNSNGDTVWVASYYKPDHGVNAIAVDPSGNVYATCSSSDEYVTVKYNAAGIQQWVARYNGSTGYNDEGPSALALDAFGNVYVTGQSGGDYATVKYNSIGVEQWVARYNGPENDWDRAVAVAVDSLGNVYITGTSRGTWALSGGTYKGTHDDYATVKYNFAGVEQWVARYDGPGDLWDRAADLAIDKLGNVYVTGSSGGREWGYGTVKYNSEGKEQWIACLSHGDQHATSLALDGSGNIYVTGTFATIKYNSEGMAQWISQYFKEGDYCPGFHELKVDVSGNVYVAGTSYCSSGSVYTIIKYTQSPTFINQHTQSIPDFFALEQNYPNPFNPSTTIRYALSNNANVKLVIYDLLGREIATLVDEEQSAGRKEVEWDASAFSSGIYFYKLTAQQKNGGKAGNYVGVKKLMLLK